MHSPQNYVTALQLFLCNNSHLSHNWIHSAQMHINMALQLSYTVLVTTVLATTVTALPARTETETYTKTFNGYQVLRINSTTLPVQTFLQHLYESDEPAFDFWTAPTGPDHHTDIALPRKLSVALRRVLEQQFGISPRVIIENLQELIEQSEKDQTRGAADESMLNWDSYHPLATIHNWLDSLENAYPNNVKVMEIGRSSENRTLRLVKVSFNSDDRANKSAIWIDGGIHAREWITPATVTYMLNELLHCATNSSTTKETCAVAAQFDWYILPVFNPDGYVHSWTKNRMWRKTRSRLAAPPLGGSNALWESTYGRCVGADPNRNFDFVWGGKGTSGNRCSDIYRGSTPASEPEVAAVQAFLTSIKENLKLFLTIHSYSQMILTPWSYDNIEPQDLPELKRVALNAAGAIEKLYGTQYRVDPPPKLLGTAAGNSMDWAKAVAGVKYAYGFELRDTGKHGFILPASLILPTAEETWAGVRSMARDMALIYNG